MNISYEIVSPGAGPVVVLVHGFMVSRDVWRLNLPLADKFSLILVDLPGHGASAAPDSQSGYNPRVIAAALENLRRSIGVKRWHLAGQSLGGCVALWYARDFPQHTTSVTLTNANMALREHCEYDQSALKARADLIRDPKGAGLRAERFHPSYASRIAPDLRHDLARGADALSAEVAANYIEYALVHPLAGELAQITTPMMLVNGIFEKSFQPLRDRFATNYPNARVVDLPGGHSINIEQAGAFNAALSAFVTFAEAGQREICGARNES